MNIQIHGNSTTHHISAQILMLLAVHSFQPESSDQLFNGSPSQLTWRRGPVFGAGSLRSHQASIGLRRTARSIIEDNHGRCGPLAYWWILSCYTVLLMTSSIDTFRRHQQQCINRIVYTDAHYSLYMLWQCSLHRIWQIYLYLLDDIHRDLLPDVKVPVKFQRTITLV